MPVLLQLQIWPLQGALYKKKIKELQWIFLNFLTLAQNSKLKSPAAVLENITYIAYANKREIQKSNWNFN